MHLSVHVVIHGCCLSGIERSIQMKCQKVKERVTFLQKRGEIRQNQR